MPPGALVMRMPAIAMLNTNRTGPTGVIVAVAAIAAVVSIAAERTDAHAHADTDADAPVHHANDAPADLWVADGRIESVAVDESRGRLYLGGTFNSVGPLTGSGRAVRPGTGLPIETATRLGGASLAATSDGAGGWYVGGTDLDAAGDRPFLVRLDASGDLHPVVLPQPDGRIEAMFRVGDVLYIGGVFETVGGVPRRNAAAVDVRAASLTPWNPQVELEDPFSDGVFVLAGDVHGIYLGGRFASIGGTPRASLARVDAADGTVQDWSPSVAIGGFVDALATDGRVVHIGGAFSEIDGQPRGNLAAVDAFGGVLTDWAPETFGFVRAMLRDGDTVYIGGTFISVNGVARSAAAAVDADTGALRPFNAQLFPNSVRSIARVGNRLYLGGRFLRSGPHPRIRVGAFDPVTGQPLAWAPAAGGDVIALATADNAGPDDDIFVGGFLRSVGGVPRGHGAALDLTTGAATEWNPRADGTITDLSVADASVFVAGGFVNAGGAFRAYAAELDADSGDATAWNPPFPDFPGYQSIAVTPDAVFIGGEFTSIGGQAIAGMAALDPETGALTAPFIGVDGAGVVESLVYDAERERLYVGGFFLTLGGTIRPGLGAIDLDRGVVAAWDPGVDSNADVRSISLRDGVVYAGGRIASVGGGTQPRFNLAAFDARTAEARPWAPDATAGQIRSVLAAPSAVHVGGTFAAIAGVARSNAAAVDPTTGDLLPDWNPQPVDSWDASGDIGVRDLAFVADDVVIAGRFASLENAPAGGLNRVGGADAGRPGCPADVTGDGAVGFDDLLGVLAAFGRLGRTPADVDADGEVGFSDVLAVLAAFGPCPD